MGLSCYLFAAFMYALAGWGFASLFADAVDIKNGLSRYADGVEELAEHGYIDRLTTFIFWPLFCFMVVVMDLIRISKKAARAMAGVL